MTRLLIASLSVVLFIACSVAATRYPGQATSKIAATGVPGRSTVAVNSPVREVTPPTTEASSRRAHLLHRAPSLNWDALAQCESGQDWQANTGNGFYGGVQFLQRTWESFDTQHFAARADLATRAQQIAVAERVLRTQGLNAWPACTRALGWR